MKNFRFKRMATLMVVIVSIAFASCGDDDNGKNSDNVTSIVGTWVKFYEKETKWSLTNGNWVKTSEKEDNESGQSALYFGADNSYCKMYLYNGNWEKGTMLSYSIQGNNLILSSSSTSSSSTKSRIFTINGTELTVTETELDGNEKEEETKRYRKM